MINFLQQYLRIDTSHPNPDYQSVIKLFAEQSQRDGLAMRVITLPSQLPVIIISLPGIHKHLPALALNHHADVVPAPDAGLWHLPPFGGRCQDGIIYGRGAQDMKGVGVMHYFALKKLKDAGITPQRSIHLIIVPHEELGGFLGAGQFIKTEVFKKLNIGFVLDEGKPSGKPSAFYIKISERKALHITLTSSGSMAHGSCMSENNCLHDLIQGLALVVQLHQKSYGELTRKSAGQLISANITSLQAGVMQHGHIAHNVIPDRATATIDIRIPPDRFVRDVLVQINNLVAKFPSITCQVNAQCEDLPYEPSNKGMLYSALERVLLQHSITPVSLYGQETSDLRFYLAHGIDGVGFTPMSVNSNLHGKNECVPVDDMVRGCQLFYELLGTF